jgi:glucose-6-phosphate dehydrogenase assembly protein OpcA
MEKPVMEEIWREEEASPARIETALREMIWRPRREDDQSRALPVPARVLNLVAIVDAGLRDEVENRLLRVGRLHPSRLVVCAVQKGRQRMTARGGVSADEATHGSGRIAVAYERVEITLGPTHLPTLDTIVDLLLVPDLATMVWSPHGYDEGVDALRRLAQVVLIDSHDGPDAASTLARATELAEDTYVVDLAWLRSTPWRERVAALFDPVDVRPDLDAITSVTVRHREDSLSAALLFCGWLCSRLGWQPLRLAGARNGHALAGQREVKIHLQAADMEPPGLDGVTIETSSGSVVSLDRASGGLRVTRREARGLERVGTLFGASRGEVGILGEGVRQALLRDPTYRPALRCARMMVRGGRG